MTGPSVDELESRRAELYAQLAEVGDFRRGSLSENYRRCGKPNCACARAEVDKVRAELANYHRFAELSEQIVEVNEAICEARPPEASTVLAPPGPDREKGGSASRSRRSSPRR